jgi:hypothetical protein
MIDNYFGETRLIRYYSGEGGLYIEKGSGKGAYKR